MRTPNEDHIRQALDRAGVKDFTIQQICRHQRPDGNEEVISLPQSSATDQAHDAGRTAIENALNSELSRLRIRPAERARLSARRRASSCSIRRSWRRCIR